MNRKNLFSKAKILLVFALIALILPNVLSSGFQPVQAKTEQPTYEQTASVEAKPIDTRALILQNYLAQKNSPMQNNAQDFIDAADKYGVDWKLVPSIAGVESTFGQAIPTGSYNAYGWGVYGTNVIYFKSWKDGIYTLNEGLKTKYIDRGLTNPYTINRVYAASPAWGAHVSSILADLTQYEQKYNKSLENSRLGNVLSIRQMPVSPKPSSAPLPGIIAFK